MAPTIPNWDTLSLVMPEIWLVLGMCAVILTPFINRRNAGLHSATAIGALVLALIATLFGSQNIGKTVFHDMLSVDPFSQFFKFLLILFTIVIVIQWLVVNRSQTHVLDVPDYLCLLLGATFGMALMASATNLLMIFVAIEAASYPSFALAGFRKRHKIASEGSLKYVIFGAASSAIMVYGMSLIYGVTGSLDLAHIAAAAKPVMDDGLIVSRMSPLLAIGLMAMLAGFAFKLSAVPLHFWCPDVFEGAPIEITTFLSVASKGAAVCLLIRTLQAFGMAGADAALIIEQQRGTLTIPFLGLAVGVGIIGAITATWGNLVAMHQNNIKRLLAYSSIAHAGYMIMAAATIIPIATKTHETQAVAGAILFYLLVYLFMNLGAFTAAALIAQQTGSEDISDYANLIRRNPMLAIVMVAFLLSLFGMPGLGGFMAKIYLMAAMSKAGAGGFLLIAVLLFNTLLSLYYYLRPVYFMVMVADDKDRPTIIPRGAGYALLLSCVIALLWTGLLPGLLSDLATDYGVLTTGSESVLVLQDPVKLITPTP